MASGTKTTLVITALPNPQSASTLTVLVSPRLRAGDAAVRKLSAWSDFGAKPWPNVLLAMQPMTLTIGGQSYGTKLTDAAFAQLDANLWAKLFPADTPVVPHVFVSGRKRPMRSFSARAIAAHVHGLYRDAAVVSGRELPPLYQGGQAENQVTAIDRFADDLAQIAPYLNDAKAYKNTPDAAADDKAPRWVDFWRALRFYRRRAPDLPPEPLDLDNEPTVPELDFHQRVALAADHPTLLRRLGLIVDIHLPVAIANLPATGTIQLTQVPWRGGGGAGDDVFPKVFYQVAGGRLLAQPGTAELAGGYLRLDPGNQDGSGKPRFELQQVDVDGAALQSFDFATNLQRMKLDRTRPAPLVSSLPTLRTGGLTLVRHDRAGWLAAHLSRAEDLDAGKAVSDGLRAEDSIRGLRLDVQDATGVWRSLCERVGWLEVAGTPRIDFPPTDSEGHVKLASATSEPGGDELYLHEAVAGWDGWSLCARRPGKSVRFDRDAGEVVDRAENQPPAGWSLRAEVRARPGLLPRLRFGKAYRLRARLVDVAGGSVAPGDAEAAYTTPWSTYRRYEPVPPPVLALRDRVGEGESLERLVVRSAPATQPGKPHLTPAQYAALPEVAASKYKAAGERHVLAPKCTLAMAETHGMLDAAGTDPASWYHVARKEAGALIDRQRVDVITRADAPVTDVVICRGPGSLDDTTPADPKKRGDSLAAGEYVVRTGSEVAMPWLPDPMAAGLALWQPAPAGVTPKQLSMAYEAKAAPWSSALAKWPELRSLQVRLEGHVDDGVDWKLFQDGRAAVVSLAPGRTLTLRYSSLPASARADELALWAQLDAGQRVALADDFAAGRHWMFTPAREVTLVHAVQRPVTPPQLENGANVARAPGETSVRMDSQLLVHGYSTSHVDVRADWVDLVDDGQDPLGVRRERHAADAFRVPVDYGQTKLPCHVVGEARERAAYMLPTAHTKSTVTAKTREARHDLGDTRHRFVSYTPVGTTRYQEYFPAALIAERRNLEAAGGASEANVPSSVRPPPPSVLYALPTFRWEDTGSGRRRVGGGVRVYLDRPWLATGEGERLAVVLAPGKQDVPPFGVSRWGADPVWSAGPANALGKNDFVMSGETVEWFDGAYKWERCVTGAEPSAERGEKVELVGVIPEWSPERKLWFADFELAQGQAYWPFLDLGLVRWQPASLPGLAISTVRRCHFVQVAPDRVASVQRWSDHVDVTLTGFTAGNALESVDSWNGADGPPPWDKMWKAPSHAQTSDGGHRVFARVEHCPPGVDPGKFDLAWTTLVGPVELRGTWQPTGEVTWAAKLPLANPPAGVLRLVLTEAEIFESDADDGTTEVYLGQLYFPGQGVKDVWKHGRERVVYLDTFTL